MTAPALPRLESVHLEPDMACFAGFLPDGQPFSVDIAQPSTLYYGSYPRPRLGDVVRLDVVDAHARLYGGILRKLLRNAK